MKIMTILGTRPEIIRMASIIKHFDLHSNHVLVHTGQNYDENLNGFFFRDLNLRLPDYQLSVKSESLGGQIANIISETSKVIESEKPDAVVVLGDTNSALSVINARRMMVPVFHIEAGDRAFDKRVPEDMNRKIVDHVADVNLAYTEYSRRNLLREGVHPSRIFVIGSPIREVYESISARISQSSILDSLNLTKGSYIAASVHREENVDDLESLTDLVNSYKLLAEEYSMPIIISTHPRTRRSLRQFGLETMDSRIRWCEPFGLIDFLKLQMDSFCVVSDSGTIHEDACVLSFPAVAIRRSTEKYEALESGHVPLSGLKPRSVVDSVKLAVEIHSNYPQMPIPVEYSAQFVSVKVFNIVTSMVLQVSHNPWGRN